MLPPPPTTIFGLVNPLLTCKMIFPLQWLENTVWVTLEWETLQYLLAIRNTECVLALFAVDIMPQELCVLWMTRVRGYPIDGMVKKWWLSYIALMVVWLKFYWLWGDKQCGKKANKKKKRGDFFFIFWFPHTVNQLASQPASQLSRHLFIYDSHSDGVTGKRFGFWFCNQ